MLLKNALKGLAGVKTEMLGLFCQRVQFKAIDLTLGDSFHLLTGTRSYLIRQVMFPFQELSLSLTLALFVTYSQTLTLTLSLYTINELPEAVRFKLKPLLTSFCLRNTATACHWIKCTHKVDPFWKYWEIMRHILDSYRPNFWKWEKFNLYPEFVLWCSFLLGFVCLFFSLVFQYELKYCMLHFVLH